MLRKLLVGNRKKEFDKNSINFREEIYNFKTYILQRIAFGKLLNNIKIVVHNFGSVTRSYIFSIECVTSTGFIIKNKTKKY